MKWIFAISVIELFVVLATSDVDEPLALDQDYANQDYANQVKADQDYANQDYANRVKADQDYANQDYANQDYANRVKADQDYANQDYADQDYANQDYANQEYDVYKRGSNARVTRKKGFWTKAWCRVRCFGKKCCGSGKCKCLRIVKIKYKV